MARMVLNKMAERVLKCAARRLRVIKPHAPLAGSLGLPGGRSLYQEVLSRQVVFLQANPWPQCLIYLL